MGVCQDSRDVVAINRGGQVPDRASSPDHRQAVAFKNPPRLASDLAGGLRRGRAGFELEDGGRRGSGGESPVVLDQVLTLAFVVNLSADLGLDLG